MSSKKKSKELGKVVGELDKARPSQVPQPTLRKSVGESGCRQDQSHPQKSNLSVLSDAFLYLSLPSSFLCCILRQMLYLLIENT